MEIYTGFASVYDIFMEDVPYAEWGGYLVGLLKEYGVRDGLVAELGCGTGNMTRRLAQAGYDMIGIDLSEEMLEIAREYEMEEPSGGAGAIGVPPRIMYLNQDMREFELYGTVAAVVSLCDSMNYITSEEELRQVFKLVNNYLDPEGVFIFDMNTIHKYRDLIGDATIAENREECSFIWENYFDAENGLNQYDITIFKKTGKKGGGNGNPLFERITETHIQKAYPIETIIRLLREAGMEFVAAYGGCTRQAATEQAERVYFIAREGRQEGKYYL